MPSGPLTQLPFQVLVTAAAPGTAAVGRVKPARPDIAGAEKNVGSPSLTQPTDYRAIPWLARSRALSVLPAVSSLKALRRVARPRAATLPMIGFGNSLLDGPDARYAGLASCSAHHRLVTIPDSRATGPPGLIGALLARGFRERMGGGGRALQCLLSQHPKMSSRCLSPGFIAPLIRGSRLWHNGSRQSPYGDA